MAEAGRPRATSSVPTAPKPANPPSPDRLRFTLSGPSRPLDHAVEAARRDLADIAVAGRWFAPHYAEPRMMTCLQDTPLFASAGGEAIAALEAGEIFAVLDMSGGWAWGYRVAERRVGYVEASALRA